ncbi:MAG: class I SAM-dependent methyltransferase, partial [bacterium]
MDSNRFFYEKIYHFDEDINIGLDHRRLKIFFKHVNFNGISRCLDIGCGVGWALHYIFSTGNVKDGIFVGLDISKKAIYLAKNIMKFDVNLLVGNGENLPFPDNYFDLVFSLGTIEHFSNPDKGLEEIKRVTRRGGKILLVVPNSYWLLNKLSLYKGTEQPLEMLATMEEWARFIQKHNLQVVKINNDIGPKIFKNRKIFGILKRLFLKFTIFMPHTFAYQF